MSKLDKQQIARHFSRAAPHYNRANPAQDAMASFLYHWACNLDLQPDTLLDLGCGTGSLGGRVARLFPESLSIGLDIAPGMLTEAARELTCRVQADMEQLPLAERSIDLLLSSAAMQWTDTAQLLPRLARLVRPGGHALLGLFVEGTLAEWHQALAAADMDPVHELPSVNQLLCQLGDGWQVVQQQSFSTRLQFDSPEAMLMSTRRTGATNARPDRSRGLTGVNRWRRLRSALESTREGEQYCLTYRSLCLHLVAN